MKKLGKKTDMGMTVGGMTSPKLPSGKKMDKKSYKHLMKKTAPKR